MRGSEDLRDEFVAAPSADAKDSVFMCSPYRLGPHNRQVPYDDEAFRVASDKALVASEESCGVDRGPVPA